MSLKRLIISGALVWACLLTVASGQTQPGAARRDVMDHIPDDALGFIVARSVRSATDAADEFLDETGISENADELSEGVLEAIAKGLVLGEGFDADGGFAVVLLNPEPLGIDVEEEISRSIAQLTVSSMPGMVGVLETIFDQRPTTQPSMPRVPYAMLFPGSDARSILPEATVSENTEGTTLSFEGVDQQFHAASLGDYVVVSPLATAVEVVREAHNRPIKLADDHAEILQASEAAAWANVGGIRDALGGLLEKLEKMEEPSDTTTAPSTQVADLMEGLKALRQPSLTGPSPLEMFKQVRQATVGLRLDERGPRAEAIVEYEPDSAYAAARVSRDTPGELLDRLPDLPYMTAIGSTVQQYPPEVVRGRLGHYLDKVEGLDEGTRREMTEVVELLFGQSRSIQFVWGSAPDEQVAGIFGMAVVIECDDSQQLRKLLARAANCGSELLVHAGEIDEDFADLEVAHSADVETIEGAPIDILTLADTGERSDMAMPMSMLFGSPDLNIRIAAADDTHLVLTSGGGESMLAEALTAARSADGPIPHREEVAAVLAEAGDQSQMVFLFNAGNYLRSMLKMFGGMGMAPPPIAEEFTDEPVVGVVGEDGDMDRFIVEFPTQIVTDFVTFIESMERMYSAPSDSGPPPDAEDF
ncbi:MAG: hypothetical protein ACLFVW_09640 [Phycisphaerae bacterium]